MIKNAIMENVEKIGRAIDVFEPVIQQSSTQFAKYLLTLVDFIKKSPKEKVAYIELGIFYGGSIIFASELIRSMTKKLVKTIAIEPYTNPVAYKNYMATHDAILIKNFSNSLEVKSIISNLRQNHIVCSFIDGDHFYKWAKKDYESLNPFSDFIAFHDVCEWNGFHSGSFTQHGFGNVCRGHGVQGGHLSIQNRSSRASVVHFWEKIKRTYPPEKVMEFLDSHSSRPRHNYRYIEKMGIGLLINSTEVKNEYIEPNPVNFKLFF